MYPNIDPKIKNSMVYFKVRSFLKAQKSPNILGYFCKKICYQQLLNIAQSGHTVGNQWDEWKRPKVTGDTKITKKIIIIFVIFFTCTSLQICWLLILDLWSFIQLDVPGNVNVNSWSTIDVDLFWCTRFVSFPLLKGIVNSNHPTLYHLCWYNSLSPTKVKSFYVGLFAP